MTRPLLDDERPSGRRMPDPGDQPAQLGRTFAADPGRDSDHSIALERDEVVPAGRPTDTHPY